MSNIKVSFYRCTKNFTARCNTGIIEVLDENNGTETGKNILEIGSAHAKLLENTLKIEKKYLELLI